MLPLLHSQAIQSDTLDILKQLQAQAELSNTRLVGGTALALQLGHRFSIDIDLFGVWDKTLVPYKPTTAIKNKLFHHEEHEAHEVCLLNQSPLRVLRGEDSGLRAEPALDLIEAHQSAADDLQPHFAVDVIVNDVPVFLGRKIGRGELAH